MTTNFEVWLDVKNDDGSLENCRAYWQDEIEVDNMGRGRPGAFVIEQSGPKGNTELYTGSFNKCVEIVIDMTAKGELDLTHVNDKWFYHIYEGVIRKGVKPNFKLRKEV